MPIIYTKQFYMKTFFIIGALVILWAGAYESFFKHNLNGYVLLVIGFLCILALIFVPKKKTE
jgi:hypothetical protein